MAPAAVREEEGRGGAPRTDPESRSGSGNTISIQSTRYEYMRVAAMWVYMVL